MSFSNDDSDDGLAALFGGVTPQKTPRPDADARPTVEPGVQPAQPAQPGAQPVAYPGLEPATQVTPPPFVPSAPTPGGYDIPAPSFGQAAGPRAAPEPYDLPAPGQSAYPGLDPAPQQYAPPQGYEPPQYSPPQYSPPQYASPQPSPQQYAPQEPATQAPAPQQATPPPFNTAQYNPAPYTPPNPESGYLPTAQYPTESPVQEPAAYDPPRYPGLDATPAYAPPAESAYTQLAAPNPSVPPQSEPPAVPSYDAPTSYPPPSFDLPAYQPPPLNAPTFDAATYAAPAAQVYDPPTYTPQTPAPEQPARAEVPIAPLPNTPAVFQPPAGPLLPSSSAAIETPEELDRSTVGEKVGVAAAILTGPIGLFLAIVAAARSARRRGWVIGVVRASLVLGAISTIVVGIGGYAAWNAQAAAIEHAGLSAQSADFCAAAQADPTMVQAPLLGWPSPNKTIQQSLDDMTAWTTRWTDLAGKSPKALAADLTLVASKGQQIIDSVTQARTIDVAGNQAVIGSAVAATGIPAWYQNYCVTP